MARRRRHQKKPQLKQAAGSPELEALEPRVLLSTFTVAPDGDALGDTMQGADTDTGAIEFRLDYADPALSTEQAVAERRIELVFVDTGVEGYEALVDDLRSSSSETRSLEVFLLDTERDGIEQISDILADYQGLDAIHIISHGTEGAVQLGNSWLSGDSLSSYESALIGWGDALSEDADLLFYGCDLAGGDSGEALVGSIAKLTGADVAASDDLTGARALGGDWTLESSTGAIETSVAFSAQTQLDWSGLLADNAPTDLETVATSDGGLRFNTDSGDDVILFADDGDAILGGLSQLTAEVRFSMDAFENSSAFLSYATASDDNSLKLNIRDDGDLSLSINSIKLNSSAMDFRTLADGTAHTISVSWDSSGGAWQMFIDGGEVDSGSGLASGQTLGSGGTLVIGNDQDWVGGGFDPAAEFAGTLFDIRIFDDVRTSGEILANFDQALSYDEPNLRAEWTFDTLSTGGVVTETVAGNNLTVQHATDPGFTTSAAELTLSVVEYATNGTVVGAVTGTDPERTTLATTLVADDPDLYYSAETGKFYKYVAATTTWTDAQTAALATDLNGASGQLMTIRSAAENEFVFGFVSAYNENVWMGASDADTEGEWRWNDSGAAGDPFWQGNSTGDAVGGAYHNWNLENEQPYASAPDDDYGMFRLLDGEWADRTSTDVLDGYVVEWDADTVLDGTASADEQPLTYSIQSQSVAGAFAIDADRGVISVADGTLIDFETDPLHTVTIRVTDASGGSYDEAVAIQLADVDPEAPMVSASGSATIAAGSVYTLNLSSANLGTITEWTINWGDGSIETIVGNPSSVTHTYAAGYSGLTLDITASATDAAGAHFANDLIAPTAFLTGEGLYRYSGEAGTFTQSFGGTELTNPFATVLGPDGLLYVAGHTSDNIVRYDAATGAFVGTFVSAGSGGLNAASGLAFGPDGLLYVSSQISDEVLKFDGTTGAFVSAFVTTGSGGLNGPVDLDFRPDGYLYVGSYNTDSVLRYDATTGAYVDTFVSAASGGLSGPGAMEWGNDGHLYIASNDGTVKRFDGSTGAFIDDFVTTGSGGLGEAIGLAFGPDGNLYVSSYSTDQIIRYDGATGALIGNHVSFGSGGLDGPTTITFLPNQQVKVVENQAPVITSDGGGATASINVAENATAVTTVTATDSEGDQLEYTITDGVDAALFAIDRNTGALTFLVAPDFESPADASGDNVYEVEVSADDQISTPDTQAISVTVTAVNEAPTAANDAATVNEGASVIIDLSGNDSDPDNALDLSSITITSGPANGTVIDNGDGTLTYIHDGSETVGDSFSYTIDDALGATSNVASVTLTINPINDDPLVVDLDGDILNYTEGDGAVLIEQGGDALVSDVDSADFAGGSLNVEIDFGLEAAEDVLAIRNQGTGAGEIGVGGSDVTYGGVAIGTFLGGTGLTPLMVTFNSNATAAAVTALVQNITYENTNLADPTGAARSVTLDVTDGDGGSTLTQNLTVNVTAVNDQAIADLDGPDGAGRDFSTTFTEGLGAVNVTDSDATISDVDTADYQGLGVNLSGFVDGASEKTTIAGYTFTFGVSEVVVRTVGSTDFDLDFDGSGFTITRNIAGNMPQADLQTLVRGITYDNLSEDPSSGNRTIDIIPQDGDGLNGLASTATISVVSVNDAPTAVNDAASVTEGASIVIDLAGNDTDPDNALDLASIMITSGPANGSLVDNGDGTLTYTHDGSETVGDSFSYTINDASGATSNVASVTLTVNPQNDAPTAVADSASVNEGDSVVLNASGSSDPDGDSLTYRWDLNNDGTYGDASGVSPTISWATLQSFGIDDDGTYTIGLQVDDGAGGIATTTTTLTVGNTAPTLVATGAASVEAGNLFTLNLSATDPGDDTITSWTINWGDGTIDTVAGNPGSVTHTYTESGLTYDVLVSATDEDGTFTDSNLLTPSDWNNLVFLLDGNTGTIEQTLPGTPQVVRPAGATIGPDGNYYVGSSGTDSVVRYDGTTGALLGTFVASGSGGLDGPFGLDFGPDGNLYVTSYGTGEILRYDGTTGALLGTFVASGSGGISSPTSVNFGPDGDLWVTDWFGGTVLRFDGSSGAALGEFADTGGFAVTDVAFAGDSVYVSNSNQGMIYEYDATTGALLDSFAAGSAYSLETGPDGHLYVSGWGSDTIERFDLTTNTSLGIFADASTGIDGPWGIEFTPDHQVTILPNLSPQLDLDANDSTEVGEDFATTFTEGGGPVAITDIDAVVSDVDSANLAWLTATITNLLDGTDEVLAADTTGTSITANYDSGTGVLTLSGSDTVANYKQVLRTITYDNASQNPTETARQIDFEANDGTSTSNTGVTTLTVSAQNDAPTAANDAASVNEGSSVTIDLAGNDTDPDNALDLSSVTITSAPANGSLVDNGDGTLTYTHDGSETVGDSFSYTIDDASGATSNVAGVTVTVNPQNDAPTAVNDSASVNEGASVTINLSDNDTDPDNGLDLASITITSAPANGTLVDNGDGTLTYTHDGSETVGDSFSYTIDDASGATSNVAGVTLTVNPQNDAPTAVDDSASVNEGASVTIDLSGNDTDPDNALDLASITITSGPANGSLVDNGDGTLTYTHDGSETVGDSFSYTIDDASGATSNVAGVTLTVNPQNDAPTAVNDSASVTESSSVTIDLAGNDTDPDNALDLASIVITSAPANGSLVDNGDGTLTYTHDGSETVGDSFSYTIDDASGATSNIAGVTLTVNPQNDAPTAVNDTASVNEGASVTINLSGNDTDPDNALDLSSIAITSGPANGSLVDNGDGTLTYTHDGSETVGDSFSYTIDDASGATSNIAGVTLTVNPQNDAPTAANDSASVNEGASVTIDLSGNDTDPDNALDLASITITSGPANGSLVDNGDGTLTYTHDGSETVGDSFSYTIDDAAGATSNVAGVTLTVSPQNDAPTAANDSASVNEGASVTIDLSGNDTDPDNALDLSSIVTTSGPANGTLVDNGDGTLTYTHDGSETVGDSFSYTINDASGATSNVAGVTLTVNPLNDAPTAVNDTASVNEGASVTIDLAGNDIDPDNALDLSSITIASGPANGTLVDNGDGTLTYTHDGSETVGDSFSYTIDDASGASSNVAGVTLTVNPQNDAPTAVDDSASVNEGASVTIDLTGNDTDPDNALDLSSIVITSGPANGTLVDNGDGTLTYTHDGSETVGDSFSYTIDDASGSTSNIAGVTLTVNPQNDAPTAVNDSASVNEGSSVTIDLTGNDTDPDNALDLASIVITSGPANGTLVDNGDGTLTYTHDGSETVGDSFSYTIDDASGATSNVAGVTLTVTPQNDAPTAVGDSASVNEGASVTIDLTGNDTDPDNALDLSSIVITSGPANGTLVDNGDGTLTYTHDGSETVGDSFSYTIDDASGATSNVAGATLTVNPQNDAPTAVNDSASVNEGSSVTINLTGNDTDPDNALDLASIVITSGPANGTLVDNGDGTLTYTHDGSETVGDSFSYTIDDASGVTSNVASVTLTVNPVNDAPLINDQVMSIDENSPVGTNLGTVAAADPDLGDSLAYAVTGGNLGGAFAIDPATGDLFVADSAPLDFETNPSIALTVEVEDLSGVRRSAIVTVNVLNVNEAVTVSGPAGLSMDLSESLVFSSSKGTAIAIGDPDGPAAPLEVTLSAGGGMLSLASTGGLTMLVGDGLNDAAMTFRGSLADVTTALDGMSFDPSGTGTATISVSVADQAAGGTSASTDLGVTVGATPTPAPVEPPPGAASTPTPSSLPPTPTAIPPAPTDPGASPTSTAPSTPPTVEQATPVFTATPAPLEAETPELRWDRTEVYAGDFAHALLVGDAQKQPEHRDREARPQVDLLRASFVHADFFQSLDQMRRDVLADAEETDNADREWLVPAIEGIAMAATSGLLAGVLRASSLLAMAVSSVPLWRRADPLTILSLSNDERRDLEATLRRAGTSEQDLDAVLEGRAASLRAKDEEAAEDD